MKTRHTHVCQLIRNHNHQEKQVSYHYILWIHKVKKDKLINKSIEYQKKRNVHQGQIYIKNISSRWGTHKKEGYGKNGMIVLTAITKEEFLHRHQGNKEGLPHQEQIY